MLSALIVSDLFPMKTLNLFAVPALLSLVLLLSACGRDHNHDHGHGHDHEVGLQAATPPVINIDAGDDMKFSVTRIEAAPGESITLTLKITGRLPKSAMGHNWVLLTRDADARAYCMSAMSAAANDYLPPALADQVLVATKLMGLGESDTITFNAPAEPGNYPFVCSFPGHFLNGMGGVLVVK